MFGHVGNSSWSSPDGMRKVAQAIAPQIVRVYSKNNFPHLQLTAAELETLADMQRSAVANATDDELPALKSICPDVKRAFVKLNCLDIFSRPAEEGYKLFCSAQPAAEKIDFLTYRVLASKFGGLTAAEKQVLRAACLLTPTLEIRQKAFVADVQYIHDEQFVADVLKKSPGIFSLWKDCNKGLQQQLRELFLPKSNCIHMMNLVDGSHMFAELRERIQNKSLSRSQYALWICHSILKMASQKSKESMSGSLYFTQTRAMDFLRFATKLAGIWEKSEYEVFLDIAKMHALPGDGENLFLRYLCAVAQLKDQSSMKQLMDWFAALPVERRDDYVNQYWTFVLENKTTQIGAMELMAALKQACELPMALDIFLSIRHAALKVYMYKSKTDVLQEAAAISYLPLLKKESIELLVNDFRSAHELSGGFQLNDSGELTYMRLSSSLSRSGLF